MPALPLLGGLQPEGPEAASLRPACLPLESVLFQELQSRLLRREGGWPLGTQGARGVLCACCDMFPCDPGSRHLPSVRWGLQGSPQARGAVRLDAHAQAAADARPARVPLHHQYSQSRLSVQGVPGARPCLGGPEEEAKGQSLLPF